MNVGVVYQYYQGHGEPGHSLVYEITQYLSERGHKVTVIAGETGYMKRGTQSKQPWHRRLFRKERDGGVSIVRTYTYSELHRSYLGRLLSFISFSLSCPIGLWLMEKPDVVFASSPPIYPMFSAWLVCKLRRIPFVIEIRDLWPASAVQLGILRSRTLISVTELIERLLYNHSSRIVALTEGIQKDIVARGWPAAKIALVTCGVDPGVLYPDATSGMAIRNQHGWDKKKVVLYFGALGDANNLPVILRAAQRLRDRDDILFVLIGDGMKRQETYEQKIALGLDNLQILAPVPKQQARRYINAADICLVTLRDIPLFEGAIPTKLVDYMACGKPVVCGLRGEAARIVEEAGAGVTFAPNDDESLAAVLAQLLADDALRSKMTESGPAFVRQHYSAIAMRQRMEEVLAVAANPSAKPSTQGMGR